MRQLLLIISFIGLTQTGHSQSFLEAYKYYRLAKAKAISNFKSQKKNIDFVKSHIVELDTVFNAYNEKTHFNFNTADTIFMIYDSPAESLFTSDIVIWSGHDTISYKQSFQIVGGKNKRVIMYGSFVQEVDRPKGLKVITERDSLMTLVAKHDYYTIKHLGDKQSITDGSFVSIYVAYRAGRIYKIESIFPKQFIIQNVYRKE